MLLALSACCRSWRQETPWGSPQRLSLGCTRVSAAPLPSVTSVTSVTSVPPIKGHKDERTGHPSVPTLSSLSPVLPSSLFLLSPLCPLPSVPTFRSPPPGAARVVCLMDHQQITAGISTLCQKIATPLQAFALPGEHEGDPSIWMDRLAAVFRYDVLSLV